MTRSVPFRELVGLHLLTGVDPVGVEGVNGILFTLDGTTYNAIEDLEDGYRSSLNEIVITEFRPRYTFPGHFVIGYMEEETILAFKDAASQLDVLRIGTNHDDSYYPFFVSEWMPENLYMNQRKDT